MQAFQRGFAILHAVSLGLLGALGGIAWLANFITVMQAGMPVGAVLAQLCLVLVSFAVHVLLITNMYTWAFGFFDLFASWGASITGGNFTAEMFLSPSTVWTIGFRITWPLIEFATGMGAIKAMFNVTPIFIALITVVVISLVFLWITKDIIMTILEFHLAVMLAPVLFPWAILSQTAEFAAFVISWFMAGCLRVLLVIASVGLALPLMEVMTPKLTFAGDPSIFGTLVMLGCAFVFFFLVNEVVKRSATIGGRGYALGLPGATLTGGLASVVGTMLSAGSGPIIAGATRAVRALRP